MGSMSDVDTSIIDTIDGALIDWETSDDAMRWTADETVLESAPSDEELTAEQIEAFLAVLPEMTRAVNKWAEDMRTAMTKLAAQVGDLGRKHPELRAALEARRSADT